MDFGYGNFGYGNFGFWIRFLDFGYGVLDTVLDTVLDILDIFLDILDTVLDTPNFGFAAYPKFCNIGYVLHSLGGLLLFFSPQYPKNYGF